jgi:hypothetical protein
MSNEEIKTVLSESSNFQAAMKNILSVILVTVLTALLQAATNVIPQLIPILQQFAVEHLPTWISGYANTWIAAAGGAVLTWLSLKQKQNVVKTSTEMLNAPPPADTLYRPKEPNA